MADYERLTIHERRALEYLGRRPHAATLHEIRRIGRVTADYPRLVETLDGLVRQGLAVRVPARTPEHDSTHPRYRRYFATRAGREAVGLPPLSLAAWNADTPKGRRRAQPEQRELTDG